MEEKTELEKSAKSYKMVKEDTHNAEVDRYKSETKLFKSKVGSEKIKKIGMIFIFLPIIAFELFFFGSLIGKMNDDTMDLMGDESKVAIIKLNKEITTTTINEQIEMFERVRENESVKKVIFVVNSPGGSPAASEEMSEYLKVFQKEKEVIVYVEDIAASGAYYIASAVKPLNVNANSILGSIGVILPILNIEELAEKVGVIEDHITVGKYKVPVTIFKKSTEDQKDYLKRHLLIPTYEVFIDRVASNRGIPKETIEKYAEGQVFVPTYEGIKGILYDKITTMVQIKESLKKEMGKEMKFVAIEPPMQGGLFPMGVTLNISPETIANHISMK